ncbi:hypothetical protein [Vibrio hangzhouensis]|uniref:Uncharacterized protein n=1 Tax=Vibrio hangzhouensis TaxID=462991 RepID=A0A1H5SZH8_9VIBR|nr:hypothetical protein [Vibrio hangzhouensis]SEF55915.1 hypothetical protein SAMN04488244_10262 [Vibrio hangzhouensis]
MKKLLSIQTLIIAFCLSLTFIPLVYKVDVPGMTLPLCEEAEAVETPIHFFVSRTIADKWSMDEIEASIKASVRKSNLTMKNSCIPMKRIVACVEVVDFSGRPLFDIDQIRRYLWELIGEDKVEQIYAKPNQFYGAVLAIEDGYFDYDVLGTTNPDEDSQFFMLSEHADEYTLEHELGHLSWAWHEDTSWFQVLDDTLEKHTSEVNKQRLKPYARGYHCGGAGTIMSYEVDILPVYSSPEVSNNGRECGIADRADNARQMREFAEQLRQKMKSYSAT